MAAKLTKTEEKAQRSIQVVYTQQRQIDGNREQVEVGVALPAGAEDYTRTDHTKTQVTKLNKNHKAQTINLISRK